MEDVDFTDDEISKELAGLGYGIIPQEQFRQFKKGFLESLLLLSLLSVYVIYCYC